MHPPLPPCALPYPAAATFTPAVALLESSSLAQVAMLSFGVKLRFSYHLALNAFHFATALAANSHICAAGFPQFPGASPAFAFCCVGGRCF